MLKESLEKDLIDHLAKRLSISHRQAMDVFYKSALSMQIDSGAYGIHYLDAAHLLEDLLENEQISKHTH
jgi:hypothetical protein